MRAKVKDKVIDPLTDFLDDEVLGGVVLLLAAIAALIWANSPWSDSYFSFWSSYVSVGFGSFEINLDLQHWINDLFMAVFFFVVGVEIKRELVSGELKERRDAMVPVVAAIGGVALPAVLFTLIAGGGAGADGWAIPAATDIAFAVGILALLGNRISTGVRVFLLTIAIVDDIIAIAIIAAFYSGGVSLGLACPCGRWACWLSLPSRSSGSGGSGPTSRWPRWSGSRPTSRGFTRRSPAWRSG